MKALLQLGLLAFLSGCIASTSPRTVWEADPLQVQRERFRAMEEGDVTALEPMLREDLRYTHTSGQTETKEQFLQALASGSRQYLAIEPDSVVVRRYGQTAVVSGRSRMRVRSSAVEQSFSIRFLEIYVQETGRRQLAAWHATRRP